jgi:hypothetical protein
MPGQPASSQFNQSLQKSYTHVRSGADVRTDPSGPPPGAVYSAVAATTTVVPLRYNHRRRSADDVACPPPHRGCERTRPTCGNAAVRREARSASRAGRVRHLRVSDPGKGAPACPPARHGPGRGRRAHPPNRQERLMITVIVLGGRCVHRERADVGRAAWLAGWIDGLA